jgi:uncharacterized protein (TIGR04222 family)
VFPFTLTGSEFLIFYALLCAAVIAGLVLWRRSREAGEGARVNLSDPYLIAGLRGGPQEAIRVAVVSLVDRGLLRVQENRDLVAEATAVGQARRPLEKAILGWFDAPRQASTVLLATDVKNATAALEGDLARVGLLPSQATKSARIGRALLVVALLWILAFLRVLQAFSRGRHNIGFLIVLAVVFAVVVAIVASPRRTTRGDEVLADLKSLFGGLKQRASSTLRAGGATADAALLAAVFGIAALPRIEFAFARQLYPKAADASTSSSCGASCGSSCGSSGGSSSSCSSGSSCGSGCGGCGGGGCGG